MAQSSALLLWFWGLGQSTAIGLSAWCLLAIGCRLAPAARARVSHWSLWLMCIAPVAMLLPLDTALLSDGLSILSKIDTGPTTKLGESAEEIALRQKSVASSEESKPLGEVSFWDGTMEEAAKWLAVVVDGGNAAKHQDSSEWSWGWLGRG